jgi:CubicO group peptidase (beta-lactamase class C family)
MTGVSEARALLTRAIASRIFPAAVAEAGDSNGVLWRQSFGRLTFEADAPATSDATVFDLASLTKPIATTSLAMQLVANRRIELHASVASLFAEWDGVDRQAVTVRDLLEHCSGLPARLLDPPPPTRREFVHDICGLPLEYEPRDRSLYSDVGFILLGFAVEDVGGALLTEQWAALVERLRLVAAGDILGFNVPRGNRETIAPTLAMDVDVRRGAVLQGEVHDNYAAALGGAAGHAGLFGNANAVGAFARVMLRAARGDATAVAPFTPQWVARTIRKGDVPGSSRALGWDTMLPSSSCGPGMSPAAFGHVGYTGTSLWVDPILDRYFVLLSNRACGGGTLDQMRDVRRAFHDALVTIE